MSGAATRLAQDWLADSSTFRQAAAQVDTLLRIQRALADARPDLPLTVVAIQGDTLVVATPSAALAAKCRQSEPSLRTSLQETWPQVNRIRFRPQRSTGAARRSAAPVRAIPAPALDGFDALRGQLGASPLRTALDRLLARRRARP